MDAAKPVAVPSFKDATVQQVFDGLQDFRNLTRERALEALRGALADKRFEEQAVESAALALFVAESWEARQGGLHAAAEAVKVWDSSDFRAALLKAVPQLLVDVEYRVRKAVAPVLEACCKIDGLSVYDALAQTVLGDINVNFKRTVAEKEELDPNLPPPPPTFLPDTEGWRSLETSMGALEAMMQGCGEVITPRIDRQMLDLLRECSKHTNRFVREYAYFSFKIAFQVCSKEAFLESVAPMTVEIVRAGIRDNWSQVRYAASVACRAFMEKAGEHRDRFYPQLLGNMCLNRHYVAQGVRIYSQDTWRTICGPLGGARLLVAHFDTVADAFVAAATAPNHAVREAACNCISELASRVAGSAMKPTVHREFFTHARVELLMKTLVKLFQDESWPVRDVASTALGYFVTAFPLDCYEYREDLLDLWFFQLVDNIPSLRQNGAAALTMAVRQWTDALWDEVAWQLEKMLPSVKDQKENSEIFSDYTPSGPFSVPKPKASTLEDKLVDPAFMDQTMFSCGSVAPKTFKKTDAKKRFKDSGCMNCAADMPNQMWEASEGFIHLLVDLAEFNAGTSGDAHDARADWLAGQLPTMAMAFGCSQYRHHYMLKQKVCERLPTLVPALGRERVLPALPALLKVLADCSAQRTHFALQLAAKAVVATWCQQLPRPDLEDACRSSDLDPVTVLGAA